MAIRKEICYSSQMQSFIGLCTITNSSQHTTADEDSTPLKLAKDALVFMVVGPDFEVPVAYELLNGLESEDRAALTLRVIRSIEMTGVRLISLTTDGLAANITTAE